MLIHKVHALTYSFPHKSINYTKISSRGLINEYEQFNLNHLIKHIFFTKIFCVTIHVNSTPPRVTVHGHYPTTVPLCEPEFHGHSRPHTYQSTIYGINYTIRHPNSPWTVTDCPSGFLNFSHFGPKFWDRSNDRSRPQTNRIINKALKSRVKQVG